MQEKLLKIKDYFCKEKQTLAVAESLTGGNIQAAFTSVSGASGFFVGGLTAYNIDQKVQLLQVERQHAAEVNCVSDKVAIHMALGVQDMFGTKCSIATTGYAEEDKDASILPHAWICVCAKRKLSTLLVDQTEGLDRVGVQKLVTEEAVNLLMEALGFYF